MNTELVAVADNEVAAAMDTESWDSAVDTSWVTEIVNMTTLTKFEWLELSPV